MPQFTDETPRAKYKVQGLAVEMPLVFVEGYALGSNEAKWANGALASTVGNAYGGDVRRAVEALNKAREEAHKAGTYTGAMDAKGKKPAPATVADLTSEDGSPWDHQARILDKFANYVLGSQTRGVGKSLLDEIAHNLATAWVKNYLKTKGKSIKLFMDTKNAEHGSEFARLVADYLAKRHDEVYAQAQAQIDAANEPVGEGDELDLGDVAEAA